MQMINNFLNKIEGSYLLILNSLIMSIWIFLSYFLYIIIDPSYNILTNWISDLAISTQGINYFFTIGIIIIGFLAFFCFIFYINFLENYIEDSIWIKPMYYHLLSLSIGFIIAGFFPLYPPNKIISVIHMTGAVLAFTGNFGFLFCGIIEWRSPKIPKALSTVSFAKIPFAIIIIVSIFSDLPAIFTDFHLSIPILYLSEWIIFILTIVWLFTHGIFTLKNSS
ncbi:MAG: DUF998 domain-containing protein [Candidatus Lokiarchaeota archaeon]|nr:DUF998 domain-containing protein [Candidatus Lokiarchaeota archaeon]